MRKILTTLCSLFFIMQFAIAQHNLYVITDAGDLETYSVSKVSFEDNQVVFENDVTEVTKNSFSATINVYFQSDEVKQFGQTIEVGICFSDTNTNPTIQDQKLILGKSLKGYSFCITDLYTGTTYYYRTYVKVGDAIIYSDVSQETTFGKQQIINVHHYVDLGLPSGLLWATCNIGAKIPADYGDYFAWGEIDSTYTTSLIITKYYNSDKTILEKEDDTAYVKWGSSWRMPTDGEFVELLNNCTWKWTSKTESTGSSHYGYVVKSKTNGNSIFLPASGYYDEYDQGRGSYGYYWSSTLNNIGAINLIFHNVRYYIQQNSIDHGYGYTIRPVAEP